MSSQRESRGVVSVDCVNSQQCGGTVDYELFDRGPVTGGGRLIEQVQAHQTCSCEYSDDDKERLTEQVQRKTKQ